MAPDHSQMLFSRHDGPFVLLFVQLNQRHSKNNQYKHDAFEGFFVCRSCGLLIGWRSYAFPSVRNKLNVYSSIQTNSVPKSERFSKVLISEVSYADFSTMRHFLAMRPRSTNSSRSRCTFGFLNGLSVRREKGIFARMRNSSVVVGGKFIIADCSGY